jgi:hypothetical protein
VIVRDYGRLCAILKEGGSSEVRISPVLYGVDFEALCM